MKYYIASRLENWEQVRALKARLDKHHECTYDWTIHGSVQMAPPDVIERVAQAEAEGVAKADKLFVLLKGGRGTHVELGIAIGLGKPVYLISNNPEDDFGTTGKTCAFYHHPLVRKVKLSDLEGVLAGWGL